LYANVLHVESNPVMRNFSGLHGAMTGVTTVTIQHNPLLEDVAALISLGTGTPLGTVSVTVWDNPNLRSLDGIRVCTSSFFFKLRYSLFEFESYVC
jgi:hypothetical protein